MSLKVGFIGMGIMGVPMSLNVLRGGYPLSVCNRSTDKCAPLIREGAGKFDSPKELAESADVVILMVTGPEAVREILDGENGLVSGIAQGKTLINMSTVSPAFAKELDKELSSRSVFFIDAPVSGSKKPAEDGALVILAGGLREKIDEFEPLLLKMGKKVVRCGQAGQGSAMKMTVNLLLGIMMEGLCESVNFGERCGLSAETIMDTILSGALNCPLFALKQDMLKNGNFPPQFPLKHITKDLRFILNTADENGAAVPAGHAVFQLYRQGMGKGFADSDFAAVKTILEKISD
jgi:3-hydroxyisobutyrate dehydrogenase-like beta-hydroxyacid dehydrogenase